MSVGSGLFFKGSHLDQSSVLEGLVDPDLDPNMDPRILFRSLRKEVEKSRFNAENPPQLVNRSDSCC